MGGGVVRASLAIYACVWLTHSASAQVVPDGGTATTVSIGANGAVTVDVAPASSDGVSLNTYDDFNVSSSGVVLDNRTQAARTIVNEVTSARTSRIEGQLSVDGQRAHVIVANPNGITINGGHFVNTGRVALTTGRISTVSRQIAPGIFQSNVQANVNSGAIRVEGAGLSGQMDTLDLIAQSIRIAAPIQLGTGVPERRLSFVAGASTTEFDSAIVPGNLSANWRTITPAGASAPGSVLVDITQPGLMSAGSIAMQVTDAGAGVRIAGAQFATARSFTLSATGEVEVVSSKIDVGTSLSVEADALSITDSTVTADAGNFVADIDDALTIKDSQVSAAGDVAVRADDVTLESSGTTQSALTALTGTTVVSADRFTNQGALLQGASDPTLASISAPDGTAPVAALTIRTTADLVNTSSSDLQAVLFGSAGDVDLQAGSSLINSRSRILSNGDIALVANNDLRNQIAAEPAVPTVTESARNGKRVWWTLFIKRKRRTAVTYDYGAALPVGQIPQITATGAVSLDADTVHNIGGQINANSGALDITAVQVETRGTGAGRLSVERVCVLACAYKTDSSFNWFAAQLNAATDINITATDSVSLDTGSIFALNNIDITTPDVTVNAVQTPLLVQRPRGLYNFWASKGAWITLRSRFASVLAETGTLTINSSRPVQVTNGVLEAGGGVNLTAGQQIVNAPAQGIVLAPSDIGVFSSFSLLRR